MLFEPVLTPPLDSSASVLADWLELIAFFNEFGIARLDVLQAALKEQEEEPEDDIGENDKLLDRLIETLENEIDSREASCDGGYPFELSSDAEELILKENWEEDDYSFYIVCLLTSHLTTDSLFDFKVDVDLIKRLRNRVFQIVSTLAMAGLAEGSAGSIGWPRVDSETVLQALKRAESRGAGFVTKNEPGQYTPPQEKDGGIDVISWTLVDRPPPTVFYYGQVASGHKWQGKPANVHIGVFNPNYLEYGPRSNIAFATLIPFRVNDVTQWINQHTMHGTIIDRTRIPTYAKRGLQLSAKGVEMDEIENMPQVTNWISDFKFAALA